jgi:uncharacterized protein DUF2505
MIVLVEHAFTGVTRARFEDLFFDEAFNTALGVKLRLGRRVLRFERTADRVVRHVRCEPDHDPDSPAKQVFGSSRASFVEELEYDLRSHRGRWRTIPNMFTDRVRNAGTLEIDELADGVRRVVRGEVVVKLFGFGRLVEKMIVAEIEKSYATTAAFTTEWLRGTRP